MQINTVIGALSGIFPHPEVPELRLGVARVYRNPLWPYQNTPFDIYPDFTVIPEPQSPDKPPLHIAKFLIDVEIETETGEISGTLIRDQLERAVLPLRLGTEGRVLVQWVKVGGGTREIVSAEGLVVPSPLPIGEHCIVVLDTASCDALRQFADVLEGVNLDYLKVPLEAFSDSFHRLRPVDCGIDLLVALEALFSESPESISLKVALRTSCLLATASASRKAIF